MVENSEDQERDARRPVAPLATAYHEAGHVVVAAYFGLPTTDVTIVPSGDAFGMATHPSPLMLDLGSEGTAAARRSAARDMIVASYAGLAAQRLVDTQAPDFHGHGDEEGAMDLSRTYAVLPRSGCFVGDEVHEAYLARLRGEAERLVRRLRTAIQALARALLSRKTIPGDEAVAFVEPIIARLGVKRS